MTKFHSLASFIFGCGFNDADLEWSTKATNLTPASNYNSNNISDLLLFTTHLQSAPPSPPSPNSLLSESVIDQRSADSMDTSNQLKSGLDSTMSSNENPHGQTADGRKAANKPAPLQNTPNTSSIYPMPASQQANTLDILMLKMQNIIEQKQQQVELDNQEELVKNQSLEIHLTPTQALTNEFSFNCSPTNSGQPTNNANSTSPSQLTSKCLGNDDEQFELSKFVLDSKFCYADFARQRARTDVTTFRVQDYSWSDHAYSLVNRLYSDVGSMLDEKFTTTYNLTYYT